MTDNQEHDDTLECFTYVQKDGETISVSKATHSNVYDVVRYLVKDKQLAQPIKHGTDDFKKAQAAIRKRKQREKDKKEAETDGQETAPKKRRVIPPSFKKSIRSFFFTCPRVKETEGVNARTEWLEVFKSLPNNTLSKAIVVLEPHLPDEKYRGDTETDPADEPEEAKPPNHVHAFVFYEKLTDLFQVVKHFDALMPGYMEECNDSGIGMKGTFDFRTGKYNNEQDPTWASKYCGIREYHEADSYEEVLKYRRDTGDSDLAAECGHIKTADATPEIYGFEEGALFPVESRLAKQVVMELGHKYLCFDLDVLLKRMNHTDRLLFKGRVINNGNYKIDSAGPADLRIMRKYLAASGSLPIEPMEEKIRRYATLASLQSEPGEYGTYYNAIEGVFQNSPDVNECKFAHDVYTMLVHGPSKMRKVPFLYGDSNSGKTTVLKGIKGLFNGAFATPVKNDSKYLYGDLKGGNKQVFLWDDFFCPSGDSFYDMLNAFEGLEGHTYRVMNGIEAPSVPIKFFCTGDTCPEKKKKTTDGEWVQDEDKTIHFRNRLALHGPFKSLPNITGAGDHPCPKQFCQWLIDHKDSTATIQLTALDEADYFVRL
jgi:hypothetical protein